MGSDSLKLSTASSLPNFPGCWELGNQEQCSIVDVGQFLAHVETLWTLWTNCPNNNFASFQMNPAYYWLLWLLINFRVLWVGHWMKTKFWGCQCRMKSSQCSRYKLWPAMTAASFLSLSPFKFANYRQISCRNISVEKKKVIIFQGGLLGWQKYNHDYPRIVIRTEMEKSYLILNPMIINLNHQ